MRRGSNDCSFAVDYNSCSGLQGVMAQRNQGPSLTPSLANCFRADLITHVTNWPADMLEKQVSGRDVIWTQRGLFNDTF